MLNVECRVGDLDSGDYGNGDITDVDHIKLVEWYKENGNDDKSEVVVVYSNDDNDDDDSEREFHGSCDDDSGGLDYDGGDLVYGGGGVDDFDKDNVVDLYYCYYYYLQLQDG